MEETPGIALLVLGVFLVVLFVLSVVLVGAISWWISRAYYLKANREQKTLFDKLSGDVRSAILEDSRNTLSVKELNDLLETKTIKQPWEGDPLPYKACPKCGSEKLERDEIIKNDDNYYVVQCPKCRWNDWTQ
jgi:hypothetical protein